jgi:xanthine dehydrogenase accessory factor
MADAVLVRGVGDVGSAVAHVLHLAGYAVAIHDDPQPTTSRRGMAFTDAVFEGEATLAGVLARRVDLVEDLTGALGTRTFPPVTTLPLSAVLELPWGSSSMPGCESGTCPKSSAVSHR